MKQRLAKIQEEASKLTGDAARRAKRLQEEMKVSLIYKLPN